MRYARRGMKRRVQESEKQDGPSRESVLGLEGQETFPVEKSACHEFVPLHEIALVKKGIRKHLPGGDAL